VVYEERPELAVFALLYMLGRFPFTRCPRTAEQIVRHLHLVAEDERLDATVRGVARRLATEWQSAADAVHERRSVH
jgi:hypothetical protein